MLFPSWNSQFFNPPMKLSSNGYEARLIFVLKFCYIHVVTVYSYRDIAW